MLGQDEQETKQQQVDKQPEDKFVNKKNSDKDKDKDNDTSDETLSKRARVKQWQKRIKDAKAKWEPEFDRMRENMDFVAGLQWSGQKKITCDEYVVNMTLRTINQRVATLYARDPKVSAKRRKRLDYEIWSGDMSEIQQAVMQSSQMVMLGMPLPPQLTALLTDFQNGRQRQKLLDRIGETIEIVYEYQQDSQEPKFKTQMKHLVRRVSVCGIGYIRPIFCRDYENELTQSETRLNLVDRAKMASRILEKFQDGKVQDTDADMQKLRELVNSFNVTPDEPEATQVKEHIVFDFPQATSIIPDPNCRIIRGFIGCHWIVEEFKFPVEFVNAFFEKDITPGQDIKEYGPDGQPIDSTTISTKQEDADSDKNKMCLWQVYDLDTKSTFIIADGYKDYIMESETVDPSTKGFWQIVPVVFNDVEVTEGCNASPFPPSDVDLIKHPQKEYNRIRNSVKRHRIANRPRGMYPEGTLKEEDLDAIQSSDYNEMIPLKGLTPGQEPGKVLQPLQLTPIAPELYDVGGVQQDVLLATGSQEANIGPAQPNVTATVGSIAEQSRISVASSDVDSLDDSLSDVAQIVGEMILKDFSPETAKRIAGPGAVLPDQNREDFLNEIELEIVAASSGRPNKAVDISNWERVVPLILQAATLPPQAQPTIQAVIKQTIEVTDSNLDAADFFPLPVPVMPTPADGASPQPNAPSQAPNGQRNNNNRQSRYQQPQKPKPRLQPHQQLNGQQQ